MRHTCIQLSINVVDDIGDIPLRRADSETQQGANLRQPN